MLVRYLARLPTKLTLLSRAPAVRLSSAALALAKPVHDIPNSQLHLRRLEFARISALLFNINRYMDAFKRPPNDTALIKYVIQKLDQPMWNNPSRHFAFDKIILFLVQNRRFEAARKIYDRMQTEGILPSNTVRAKMLGISVVCSHEGEDDDLLQSLEPVFSQKVYDEDSLRELLDLLVFSGVSPDLINRIFNLYVSSRGEGYHPSGKLTGDMIDIQIRGGLAEAAKDLLDLHAKKPEKQLEDDQDTDASYPYVTMLKALRNSHNPDAAAIDAILQRMKQDSVMPDIPLFNTLIATEVWRQAYHQVFTLYRVIRAAPKEMKFRPDAFTFESLFKAMGVVKSGSRKWRLVADTVSIRDLYRDMVMYHLIETRGEPWLPSFVATPSVLEVALRTFMAVRDFPAAFVVLRSFSTYKRKLTLSTYLIVIKSLVAAICRELRGPHRVSGSLASLIPNVRPSGEAPHPVSTFTFIVEQILALGMERPLVPEHGTAKNVPPSHSSKPYRIPTISMLTGKECVSPEMSFDVIPLQRILRKVILADIGRFTGSITQDTHLHTPAQTVSQIITETKRVMLPEMTPDLKAMIMKKKKPSDRDRRKYWAKSNKFLVGVKPQSLPGQPHIRLWE